MLRVSYLFRGGPTMEFNSGFLRARASESPELDSITPGTCDRYALLRRSGRDIINQAPRVQGSKPVGGGLR